MSRRLNYAFMNAGHFLDHFLLLLFASVAALKLSDQWGMTYAQLVPYATPSFAAFGLFAIPAGWLADKWSREGMMSVFFIGIGLSTMMSAFARTPLELSFGLLGIGIFAAIYHPVGLSIVVEISRRTGLAVAVNGVFGNLGVAAAPLIAGAFIDFFGWQYAFFWPGLASVIVGLVYTFLLRSHRKFHEQSNDQITGSLKSTSLSLSLSRETTIRVFLIIIISTALGGLIFQSTTFALPRIFSERLEGLNVSATTIGWYAFLTFTLAAFAQVLVGYMVDNYSIRTVFAFVALMQAAFFAVVTYVSGIFVLIAAICFMLAVFGQIPINDVLIGRIAQAEWRSRIYAFRYVVTFSVMALTLPFIAWVHAGWGFGLLFSILSAAAGCIFVVVLFLPSNQLKVREA